MTNPTIELLKDLRPADAEHVDEIFPLPQRTALLEDILRNTVRPSELAIRRRWRPSTRLAASGIGAAGAVTAVLVVTLAGSSTATAFAGWSATPTPPAAGQLQAAEAACRHRSPKLASVTPTVADTRGPDSLLVFAKNGATTTCVTGRIQLGTVATSKAASATLVAADGIEPESIGLEFAADGQVFREMTGQVGAGVTGVTVVLTGGSAVQATVTNGWFAAWWPVSPGFESGQALTQSLGQSVPRSFELATASGTSTQPLTLAEIQNATQPANLDGSSPAPAASGTSSGSTGAAGAATSGASGVGGSTGSAPPGIDQALWDSFALLRQPGPNPQPVPEGLDTGDTPDSSTNPYGIDPSFDEYAAAANTWIQAGSSGICLVAYGNDPHFPKLGDGSCASTVMALGGDMFDRIGQTYVGLAPDGNTTVTVTDADGSTRQIPVSGNVYKVVGGDPASITLRDASGALTTVPLPSTPGTGQTPPAGGSTGASGPSGGTGAGAASSIDSALTASFAVLRQPQPSPVPLPAGISGAYTGPAQPPNPYGVDPNYAQYVAAAKTWVLPGRSGICIQGPSAGCNSTQAALSGDFLFSTGNTYVGLAPDGNTTVTVTDSDGSTRQAPVTDNVYLITGGNPSSITLRDASGATTTVPIPSSGA